MRVIKKNPTKSILVLMVLLVVLSTINAIAGDPVKEKSVFKQIFEQKQQFLLVDGIVKYGRTTKMTGVEVALVEDGDVVKTVKTNKHGKYKFVLEKDRDYKIIIRKPGYESKTIAFNTMMPEKSPKYNKYLMAVYLKRDSYNLEEIEAQKEADIVPSEFEPIASVEYDERHLKYRKNYGLTSKN
tara:strand:- start:3121 stop:3672 length:552 start_codon:yes stop_codon:yes gene_type:complete